MAEDLSFNIKGDASDLIDEINKLGVTSKNISEKISRELAEALGGDFTTKVMLEVEADTGQLKLVQRETNAFIEALVKGLQRIEQQQAKLAAAQAKQLKDDEVAAKRAYDKWEQNQEKKRRKEEKDAAARESQRQKEEAAAAKAAAKAIADADKQYNAYLQNLMKRQAAEQAAEAKRLADIRKTNEAAEKAAAKQEAIAAKLKAEQEKIAAAVAKEAQIRAGSLNDLNRRLQKEQETLNNLKRGTAEYEKQAKIVQELSRARKIEITGLSGKDLDAKAAQASLGKLLDDFNRISFAASAFLGIIGSISNAFGGFVRAQANLQAFELSFKAIGAGSQGAALALSESSKIALNLGADINTVRDGFLRLSPVILQSGGTINDVSAIVESLSSRFAIFGKSAAESQRIMNGVIQAFGKGKLMAEELNQQISEADPAFRIDLANAIGVSVSKLGEMVKAGQITSAELIKYIPLMSKASLVTGKLGASALSAADALANSRVTITQFQTQLSNLTQLNLERLGAQFQPLLIALVKVTAAVVDFVTTLTKSQSFAAFAAIVNSTATVFASLGVVLIETLNIALRILEPIGALVTSLMEIPGIATLVGAALTTYIITTLGIVISKSEIASLAIKQFGEILGGLRAGATAIGNVFQSIAEKVSNFGKNTSQAIQQVKVQDLGSVANGLNQIGPAAQSSASAIVKYDAAQAQLNSRFSTVAAAAATQARSFLNTVGPGLAAAAAIYGVSIAFNSYKRSLGDSEEISKRITNEFSKIDQEAQDLINGLNNTSQAVDLFSRSLDELVRKGDTRNFIQKITQAFSQDSLQNANAFANEINKISTRLQELAPAGLAVTQALKNYNGAQKESLLETTKLEATTSAYLKKLSVLLTETIKARDAALQKAAADGVVTEQEAQMLTIMNNTVKTLQSEIKSLEEAARAKGLNVGANKQLGDSEEELQAKLIESAKLVEESAQAQIEELRRISEAQIANIENAKRIVTEKTQSEIEGLQRVLDETKRVNDQKIAFLEKEKAKQLEVFDAALSALNSEKNALQIQEQQVMAGFERRKQAMNAYYDAELGRIDEQIAAINKVFEAQIGALSAPGPAEQKVKELELMRLREQARSAATAEERLRAQAQLERLAREEQIAILREQQARKIAVLEQQQAEIKKKQLEEEKKLEEDTRLAKEKFQQRQIEIEQQIQALTVARKEYEKKADAEIADFKEKAKEREQELEDQIKAKKDKLRAEEKKYEEEIRKIKEETARRIQEYEDKIAKAKENVKKITDKQLLNEQGITRELEKQLRLIDEMQRRKGGGSNRFAGGPVSGGAKYTVNELGQEAFLSRGGQLSMIKAPSWGQWRAPGAGTVIPAHITAGLNIPKNGVPVNTSANKNATRVDGSGMTAAMLRAFSGGSQGRVTNNVTIQSQSPVTDASRMLVEMSKLRVRRK